MRIATSAIVTVVVFSLIGCGTGDVDVSSALTWEKAKADAQATELELADLVPSEQVVSIAQSPKGILLSCDSERHQWTGRTKIALIDGADRNAIALSIIAHFNTADQFSVTEHTLSESKTMFQLIAKDNEENYIVRPNNAGGLDISSASTCFTLPHGTYPGGEF